MRSDFSKILVERERVGSSTGYFFKRSNRRKFNNQRNFENAEKGGKIKDFHGYYGTKSLNENLSPLKRFLLSRVGQNWDKVYSEICSVMDKDNTIQAHIFQHVWGFVQKDIVKIEKGIPYILTYFKYHKEKFYPIFRSKGNDQFWIHPKTNILHLAPTRGKYKQNPKYSPLIRKKISGRIQFYRKEGTWYHLDIRELPNGVSWGDIDSIWCTNTDRTTYEVRIVLCDKKDMFVKPYENKYKGYSILTEESEYYKNAAIREYGSKHLACNGIGECLTKKELKKYKLENL